MDSLNPLNASRVQAINSFGNFAKLMAKQKAVLTPSMKAGVERAVAAYDDWNRKYAGKPCSTVISR